MTVRDLANHILDLEIWWAILFIPLFAFLVGFGRNVAEDAAVLGEKHATKLANRRRTRGSSDE